MKIIFRNIQLIFNTSKITQKIKIWPSFVDLLIILVGGTKKVEIKCPTWNSNHKLILILASNRTLSCVFEGFFISLKACHVHYHLYVKTNQEKVDIKRKAYVVLCCSAVKSNVHFRTNAQNVSYFQLMWKLAQFFQKIKRHNFLKNNALLLFFMEPQF